MARISCVSIDLWLTLIKPNHNSHMARAKILARAFGVEATDAFSQMVRDVSKELDIRSEDTGIDFDCGDRIDLLAEKLGRKERKPAWRSLIVQMCQSSIRKFQPTLLEPDTLENLAALKSKGVKLALVSNTGYPEPAVMRDIVANLGLAELFDLMLFSGEMGIAKPAPGVFQRICDEFGILPGEILHVGDSRKADYEGARAFGARALLFSPNEPGIEHERIASVADILDYVDEPEAVSRVALYELTEDGGLVTDRRGNAFSVSDYSRFKHGDASLLKQFGYQLADFFFGRFEAELRNDSTNFIIAPFAYMHVPTAAGNMMEWFHERLGMHLRALGLPCLERLHIYKYVRNHSQDHNYARLPVEERRRILNATRLSVDQPRLSGKTLVIIDDIYVTGSSERKVLETVRGVGARDIVCLYVARMDERVAASDPGIESRLNQATVKDLDDLLEIFQPGMYRMNLRNCKFILESERGAVSKFVRKLDSAVLRELYLNCLANSYYLEPRYEEPIRLFEAELRERGVLPALDTVQPARPARYAGQGSGS